MIVEHKEARFTEDKPCDGDNCSTVFTADTTYSVVYGLSNKLGLYFCCPMCAIYGERVAHYEDVATENKKSVNRQKGSAHYKGSDIEPIDYIMAMGWLEGFAKGNVVKYISRAGRLGTDSLSDLKKAKHYIEFLEELYE